jgi:hypothetical protein
MLDQNHLQLMKTWTDVDLPVILPKAENADFEFKSSQIPDGKLQTALQKAASGFWNSGGGHFIIGVDGNGQPDGGITPTVGRTSRRDWIDRAISSVSPAFPNGYLIQEITSTGTGLNIIPVKAVYAVGFVASEFAPHMAEGCYYIRAGAHTDPAPAFIVEAIFARRGRRQPQLRLQFRRDPIMADTLQLGVVNVGNVVAIDVEVEFEKPPIRVPVHGGKAVVRAHIIDQSTPFYFDYIDQGFHQSNQSILLSTQPNHVVLRYKDSFLNSYVQSEIIDIRSTVTVDLFGGGDMNRIAGSLQHIVNALCRIEHKIPAEPSKNR